MDTELLLMLHLLCAILFIGVVAFEVLILEGIRSFLPVQHMTLVEQGIHIRGRKIMPPIVVLLFITGATMAYAHFEAMDWQIFDSSFGILLSLKILLALSVLVHFILAMKHSICGTMTSKIFKYTHLSVFIHMILIVVLAKSLFYITW
jgi:hypothetical protein